MTNPSVSGTDVKPTDRQTRVLLIGERFLLLDALRIALMAEDMDVAAIGTSRQGVEEGIGAFRPDVVVYDASQSSVESGLRAIRSLKDSGLVVTAIAAQAISVAAAQMVGAGAEYVLGLDAGLEDVATAITRCLAGDDAMPLDRRYALEKLLRSHRTAEQRRWLPFQELTTRERGIFELVYQGMSAEQIAEDVCVSLSTVRSHIRNILTKLNVNSQLSAVAMARSNEWFTTDSRVAG